MIVPALIIGSFGVIVVVYVVGIIPLHWYYHAIAKRVLGKYYSLYMEGITPEMINSSSTGESMNFSPWPTRLRNSISRNPTQVDLDCLRADVTK